MQQVIRRLAREVEAQDLIEYALLSALLALACIAGILELSRLREFFSAVGAVLDRVI